MTAGDMAGCRVLVVEDETLIAFEIESSLEALGVQDRRPREYAGERAPAGQGNRVGRGNSGRDRPWRKNISCCRATSRSRHPVRAGERLRRLGAPRDAAGAPSSDEALHAGRTGRKGQASLLRKGKAQARHPARRNFVARALIIIYRA